MVTRRLLVVFALVGMAAFGSFWAASPASAASANIGIDHNGGAPNINAGPALVVEGGTVDVRLISQAAPPGLGAWTIDIHYNDTVLDATACVPGAGIGNVCNPSFSATEVRDSGADIGGVSGTVNLMTMTFTTAPLAVRGQCSALGPEVVILTDPLTVPVASVVSNGQICIVGCADTTGDGRVTGRDVVQILLRVIFGRPYAAAYDLNGDGAVNLADVFIAAGQLGTSC